MWARGLLPWPFSKNKGSLRGVEAEFYCGESGFFSGWVEKSAEDMVCFKTNRKAGSIPMRNVKIVADSSADLLRLQDFAFAAAPLKILAQDREFVDDETLDVTGMVQWFDSYKGKSKTSCPNPGDWLQAFGDAQEVYCVTITSGLSGSYNSACIAKQLYEEKHPGRKVWVVDSLSAGPELVLLIEKLQEYIRQELPFEEICEGIEGYKAQTGLVLLFGCHFVIYFDFFSFFHSFYTALKFIFQK